MKTASVADLRNHFRRVSSWIENGESVQIVKRGRAFARLIPAGEIQSKPAQIDWAAQAREIWGDRVLSAAEIKSIDEFEHEGQEG